MEKSMSNEQAERIITLLTQMVETQNKLLRLFSQYDEQYHIEVMGDGIVRPPQ